MSIKHALIVDDSRSACVVLSRLLSRYGIISDAVNSAHQSFEYLQSHTPDVIFMDHSMPDMDGLEAVEKIKSNPAWATIPVFMFTAKTGHGYIEQVKQLGVLDVLPKSLDYSSITSVLSKLGQLSPSDLESELVEEPSSEQKLQVWLESLIENKVIPALTYRVDSSTRELREEVLQNSTRLYQKSLQFHIDQQKKLVNQIAAERDFLKAAYAEQQIQVQKKLTVFLSTAIVVILISGVILWDFDRENRLYLEGQIASLSDHPMVLVEPKAEVRDKPQEQIEEHQTEGQISEQLQERSTIFNDQGDAVGEVMDYFDNGHGLLARSSTNYFFRVTQQGMIDFYNGDKFFSSQDCFGDIWIESQSGMLYRFNNTLWYTPVDAKPQKVSVFSRLSNGGECESVDLQPELVQLLPNEFGRTGVASEQVRLQR